MTQSLRLGDLVPESGKLRHLEVSGLAMDSRNVRPGDGFVALAGRSAHGLQFAERACALGAVVVLYDEASAQLPQLPDNALHVGDLRRRLAKMAYQMYGRCFAQVSLTGVTGTNGKTSIVQLLVQAWQSRMISAASIGTLGSGMAGQLQPTGMTTPDLLQMYRTLAEVAGAGAQSVAIEASSHALDQGRLEGIPFRYAVFTNLTHDHLDYHQDMQSYGAAKSRLLHWPTLQAAILNFDDPYVYQFAQQLPPSLCVYGFSLHGQPDAALQARDITLRQDGVHFTLSFQDERERIESPLLGTMNIANLMAVAGVLLAQGFNFTTVAQSITSLKPVKGRMESIVGNQHHATVIVDYAHTPDALEQVLSVLRTLSTGRVICVFGCGGQRDRDKRASMGAIAQEAADIVILTDDNPRFEDGDAIIRDILTGFNDPTSVIVQRDRAAAIRIAIDHSRPGDMVLVAGKGHETEQVVKAHRQAFDDISVAKAVLANRRPPNEAN